MEGKTISELQIGQTEQMTKTVSESDVYLFAGITGDLNPAHVNEVYAKGTKFNGRIVHGMLLGGFISAVIAMRLPGPGTIYMGQTLNFKAPVALGDTVTATVKVIDIDLEKKRARLETVCSIQDGTVVLDGEALVSPPR
jgi:3-hydroxybutyryl-CoA dehydratase